jgi:hypothetical protein
LKYNGKKINDSCLYSWTEVVSTIDNNFTIYLYLAVDLCWLRLTGLTSYQNFCLYILYKVKLIENWRKVE